MIDSKLPAGCEEAARKPPKAGVGKATSTREATMHAQIDDLLTPTYVLVDDFLPKRRGPGRPPRITDAELITLAIAQVFMGLPNDRQFWLFDSTPVPCGASHETVRRSEFAGIAAHVYCRSHS